MKKEYFSALLIFSGIFSITLVVLLTYLKWHHLAFINITPDGKLYYNLAQNLVDGNGLINTVRKEEIIVPPLFALILAPFALLFNSAIPFFYFQYVLYGLNGVFTAYLVKKMYKSDIAALFAGLLYALQPVLYINGPQFLLTETIFISFILIVLWLLMIWIDSEGSSKIGGLLITVVAVSLLFRPHLLYMFGIISLLILFYHWKKKRSLWVFLFFLIPFILILVNGLYNEKIHGEFATLENYSGQNLYIANNPNSDVRFYATPLLKDFVEPYFFTLQDETLSVRSAILKKRAETYMIHNPIESTVRIIKKMALFFKPISHIDALTLLLSFTGLILSFIYDRKRWLLHSAILLFIIGFTALTSLGLLVGGQRYRAPLIPVYLLYSGYLIFFIQALLSKGEKAS